MLWLNETQPIKPLSVESWQNPDASQLTAVNNIFTAM